MSIFDNLVNKNSHVLLKKVGLMAWLTRKFTKWDSLRIFWKQMMFVRVLDEYNIEKIRHHIIFKNKCIIILFG